MLLFNKHYKYSDYLHIFKQFNDITVRYTPLSPSSHCLLTNVILRTLSSSSVFVDEVISLLQARKV